MTQANFDHPALKYSFLSPALLEFLSGSRATYEVCDVRYESSVAVLVGAEQWASVPYHVLLPHKDGRFNFNRPEFLRGDRIMTGNFFGYRRNGQPFHDRLFLGAVRGDGKPEGFPRAAIAPCGYLNPTHVGDRQLTTVVQHATRRSTPIRGRVVACGNDSIDVEGDGLMMPARVAKRLVRGSVRCGDPVDLHVTYVPRGTFVDRRLTYVTNPAWDVQTEWGMKRSTENRTPVVNWVEPVDRHTERRQHERGIVAQDMQRSSHGSSTSGVDSKRSREKSPPRKRTRRYWEWEWQ